MQTYSHSRLSSFENCPRQFKFRYIEKIKTEREGIEAYLGKRVHEILERLYHHVGRYGRPPSLAQVHERFQKDWRLHWHDKIHIVREEHDVEDYTVMGSRCLENYYRSHYPFDDGETVGIEHAIHASLDGQRRYKVRGVVDRIVRRAKGRYEIHDYKTGRWLPPRARIDSDRQLALYQIGLEQGYSDVEEVELVWHYLTFNKTLRSQRSPEQLDTLRSETMELIDTIETASEHPAKTGPLCRWCEYRDLCPEGQQIGADPSKAAAGPEPPPPGTAAEEGRPAPLGDPVQLSLI